MVTVKNSGHFYQNGKFLSREEGIAAGLRPDTGKTGTTNRPRHTFRKRRGRPPASGKRFPQRCRGYHREGETVFPYS